MWYPLPFLATKKLRSASYFPKKVVDWFLQFSRERLQRWKWENKAEGTLLSYLRVFSNYTPFRLPIAHVLPTSKHDALGPPVESNSSNACSQLPGSTSTACCWASLLVNFRRVVWLIWYSDWDQNTVIWLYFFEVPVEGYYLLTFDQEQNEASFFFFFF